MVLLTLPLIPLNFSTTVISIYSPVTTTYFYFHGYGDIVNDIEDLPSHKSTLSQYIVLFISSLSHLVQNPLLIAMEHLWQKALHKKLIETDLSLQSCLYLC